MLIIDAGLGWCAAWRLPTAARWPCWTPAAGEDLTVAADGAVYVASAPVQGTVGLRKLTGCRRAGVGQGLRLPERPGPGRRWRRGSRHGRHAPPADGLRPGPRAARPHPATGPPTRPTAG
ncbi:MAG: hypothetical protein IPJ58_16305 [Ardenticatenia bacterium]|nr:hypothetical protein [Ardenticatenia bacterium]